jgi:hypothetical protein
MIQKQNSSEWLIFIVYSQRSPKAVILHNENSKPSTQIVHSVHLKEAKDKMKILLEANQYNFQQWGMCGNLKMTGMLMGMDGGFRNFCSLLAFGIVALQPNIT